MHYFFDRYGSRKLIYTAVTECALIFLISLLSAAVRMRFGRSELLSYDPSFIKTAALTLTYMTAFYYFDLYSPDMYRPGRLMFIKTLEATAVATVALFAIYYAFPELKTWRGVLLINTSLIPFGVLAWRSVMTRLSKASIPSDKVLIIGSGDLAKKIGKEIYTTPDLGLKLHGFIDDDPSKLGVSIVNPGVIGGFGDILRIAVDDGVDKIIVALPDRRVKLPMAALLECKLKGITVEEGETFKERLTGKIPLDHLKPSWMVFSDGFKSIRSWKGVKRASDLALSAACLVIAAPVMLLTAMLIKLESRGPVIFKQLRVGEHGKEFNIYKFRSMREDAESKTGPVWAKAVDDRVTRMGAFIRKVRIDELPQLVNVLKGDMSFVGPRPERPFFVSKLRQAIPYYDVRSVVKPGITGWAQIKYPYGATVEDALEKLQYEIYYIKNMSPLLDALIFFWTIKVVLTGKGAR